MIPVALIDTGERTLGPSPASQARVAGGLSRTVPSCAPPIPEGLSS